MNAGLTAVEFIEKYAEAQTEEVEDEGFEYLFNMMHDSKKHWIEVLGGNHDNMDEFINLLKLLTPILPKCGPWLPVSVLRLGFANRNEYYDEWSTLLHATCEEFNRRGMDSARMLIGLDQPVNSGIVREAMTKKEINNNGFKLEKRRYLIGVREVYVSMREVEANSLNEAFDAAQDASREVDLEYSHTMDREHWSVEVIDGSRPPSFTRR